MTPPFNVLVSSASKKVPLIKCLRQALYDLRIEGSVIGADAKAECISRYFVDEFWQMPLLELITIDELIAFCTHKGVKAIIPTRDGELPFFAKHKDHLQERGIACLVPSVDAVEKCWDKLLFCNTLTQLGFPAIPTSKTPGERHASSYVVKEQFGAGTRSVFLELSLPEVQEKAKQIKHPIFQPFIKGIEYSIDLYISKSGEPKGAIARKRDLVVEGESQITTSEKQPELEALCLKIGKALGLVGHAVFQAIKDPSGHFHIIECNPRFGGASTLSSAMGLKSFQWFLEEVLTLPPSTFNRSPHEMKQVRFADDAIFPIGPSR